MSLHESTVTDLTVTGVFNETSTTSAYGSKEHSILLFILLPATAIVCLGIAIGLVAWILKRSRLDKLRNHLMPLYNFENSDSGQDLETDLLSQDVRLRDKLAEHVLPESKCGFRAKRSTDMIFSLRQLQEKRRDKNRSLFIAFIHRSKAFDMVSRPGFYKILRHIE